MTTYVYVNGTLGTASPSTKFYTAAQSPAPTTDAWNTLANAEADATIRGRTDDLIFVCVGSVGAVTLSTSLSCSSVTVRGDVSSAAWSGTEATISVTNSTQCGIKALKAVSTTVENIQITHTGSNFNPNGIEFAQASGSGANLVKNCKVRISGSGAGSGYGITQSVDNYSFDVVNCLVQKTGSPGGSRWGLYGKFNPTCKAYNNVSEGFNGSGEAGIIYFDTIKNCAVFNCATDIDSFGSPTVNYCATDDTVSGTGNINSITWTNQFQDYVNGDFRLKSGSALIGAGIGPSSDANVPSTDIAGVTRSGTTTDIGAAMFVATGLIPLSWTKLL